jgi:hypothetical protein
LKSTRHKKLLGLSVGDRSLLAAEVVAGDKPQIRKVAEMIYPQGVTPLQPAELGAALGHFLKEQGFTCRVAVIGIPVKWLVVKPKEVPPADTATLIPLLRLQAEAEFSSELKDLVYDFAPDSVRGAEAKSVLLMATQNRFINAITTICEAARVQPIAITPSALALGEATGNAMNSGATNSNVLVLSVGHGGSEMTSQRGGASGAIRHLRPPVPVPAFVSELRRAVSGLPASGGGMREIVLWDGAGVDSASLGTELGVKISSGELPTLGVDTSIIGLNGDGSKYAAAVSLAIAGLAGGPDVDFLHSRLAPPKEGRIPKWATSAVLALIVVIAGSVLAYQYQQKLQSQLDVAKQKVDGQSAIVLQATKFVGMAGLAQYWHGDDGRFADCIRDVTNAIPVDNVTFVTSLEITAEKPVSPGAVTSIKPSRADENHALSVILNGKTQNSDRVALLVQRMRNNPAFTEIKRGQESRSGTTIRGQQPLWAFSVAFNYVAPKPTATAAAK